MSCNKAKLVNDLRQSLVFDDFIVKKGEGRENVR
jgi:hypothetical protein